MWVRAWERRGHHPMLRYLEWIGSLAVPIRGFCTEATGSLATAIWVVVVERNWDCTPVCNEQRTIRLVLVVADCWNISPGLQKRSRNHPKIRISPRPYGGFGLALMGVYW